MDPVAEGYTIEGVLELPGPLPRGGGEASIAVVDAGQADAPATVVASTRMVLAGDSTGPLRFHLSLPAARGAHQRWIFDATVTATREGKLAPGDYVLDHTVVCPDTAPVAPVRLTLAVVN